MMKRVRLVLAAFLALGAAVCMRMWGGSLPVSLWIPTGLLAVTALLVFHPRPASQLLARASLWSNLCLGFLISTGGGSKERVVAAALASCTGGALLLLGRLGLDEGEGPEFAPLAYRTTIFSLFLLSLADVQGLTFFAGLMAESWRVTLAWVPLGLAVALTVGLVGLYRLRVWGLALNVLANLGLIACVATRALDLPDPILAGLAVSATLQIALCLPLIAALARGGMRPNRTFNRPGSILAGVVVVALVGFSVVAGAILNCPLIRW